MIHLKLSKSCTKEIKMTVWEIQMFLENNHIYLRKYRMEDGLETDYR